MVIDQVEVWLVELRSGVRLSDCETNGIGKSLTERSSCYFNAGGILCFRMTRSNAVDLL